MLTDRQKIILQILVDDYIRSAEPVGSRTISKRPDLSISPATIRNEMSDLEELGYLEQPHTSAGRIPSQKGYRFYVDHLMKPSQLEGSTSDSLRAFLIEQIDEMEQVVQHTATILASLTNYTALALGPQTFTATLRHIKLLPLQDRMAVAIIVTDTGHVENRTVTIPEGVSVESIQQYVDLLNDKLIGLPLHTLKERLRTEVSAELRRYSEQFDGVMDLLDQMITTKEEQAKVFLGGTTMILNQPEFRDVNKLKPLLDMFGQSESLVKLLQGTQEEGIQVRIGQENPLETVHECSLITASYSIDGRHLGTIGVLGPTRMDYGRVIGAMHHLSLALPSLFNLRLHK
jgi:heat-inducible transcriptional repressor